MTILAGRRGAVVALVAVLAAASPSCGRREATPLRPRNVLLIVADTLRADRLGCYGYPRPTSPTLDALALEGTLYEDGHPQSCWTIPSMISLMTGRYVSQEVQLLPADLPVLAQVLHEAGWTTAAFVGNKVLVVDRGFERGFDHFTHGGTNGKAMTLAARFREWFEAWRADRTRGDEASPGFFAWVHPMDPHAPYRPEPRFDRFAGPRPDRARLEPRWRAVQERAESLVPPGQPVAGFAETLAAIDGVTARYDGEVRAVDEGVREILDELREAGELAGTLILFASDHGEMLFEHPLYPAEARRRRETTGPPAGGARDLLAQGHRAWFYEELWHTPLILAGPGMPRGRRVRGLAANLDLAPTILDALGLPPEPSFAGESLWGGREPTRRRVYAHGHDTTALADAAGVKCIVHTREQFDLPEEAPRPVELFDRGRDPTESTDLSTTRRDLAERLLEDVKIWRRRHWRELEERVTPEAEEALRQLGYGGGGGAGP